MGNLISKRHRRRKHNKGENGDAHQPAANPHVAEFVPATSGGEFVRAMYAYSAQNQDDLSFSKDDILLILSKHDDPWWLAEHTSTKQKGYIPNNYVVLHDNKPQSLDAWFDIGRNNAVQLLMRMGNPSGTYIVRESHDAGSYALSVRFNSQPNYWEVRHYKIKTENNESVFFIDSQKKFSLMSEMIRYYTDHHGLCCRLSQPCPRVIKPPVQFRDLEVARQSIEYVKPLGNGCFGEVFLGKWNRVLEVAVKQLKNGSMGVERSKFIGEAKIMHGLHHPKIVQILGVCTQPETEPCLIITELMINGALLDFMRKGDGRHFTFDQLLDIIAQVAEGMAYLEQQNFVHRDLRAANILVGENNFVKVADFGLSLNMEEEEIYSGNQETKFPVKWTALEALTRKEFSIKSDVWSFGVLIYEVITYGSAPYEGMTNAQVMDFVKEGHRMKNPDGRVVGNTRVYCPDELYTIMCDCWNAKPKLRYTFEYLKDVFNEFVVQVVDTQYQDSTPNRA